MKKNYKKILIYFISPLVLLVGFSNCGPEGDMPNYSHFRLGRDNEGVYKNVYFEGGVKKPVTTVTKELEMDPCENCKITIKRFDSGNEDVDWVDFYLYDAEKKLIAEYKGGFIYGDNNLNISSIPTGKISVKIVYH